MCFGGRGRSMSAEHALCFQGKKGQAILKVHMYRAVEHLGARKASSCYRQGSKLLGLLLAGSTGQRGAT